MVEIVKESFRSLYGKEPNKVVKAPGRINLIGEHTDYNGGLVLPAAIDKCMYFAFATNNSNEGRVYAKDLDEYTVIDFDNLEKTSSVWTNYIIGLIREFKSNGFELAGFECLFSSDVPIGAGMSSSAALECGFAMGMDSIIESKLEKLDIVDMSHHSNHTFMNIYGGILDQFSSLFGKEGQCMLMNCQDRSFDYYDIDLAGYCLVLINTNVQHEHTSSGYNDRAAECKEIVTRLSLKYKDISNISNASLSMINDEEVGLTDTLKKRAKYIISENKRVVDFSAAMKLGDVSRLGELLYQSHFGLQYHYEVSCSELDLLVDLTRKNKDVLGARMMGGGFGGCTINLMKEDRAVSVTDKIMKDYQTKTNIEPESYFVKVSGGAVVIKN